MDLLVVIVLAAAIVFGMNRLTRASRRPLPRPVGSLRSAETDARAWVERLGSSLVPLDPGAGIAAREAHLDALARYDTARARLAGASSPYEFSLAGRAAIEGLHYVRAARAAEGLPVDADGARVPSTGPDLALAGQVVVAGTTYYATPHASDAMPYYFPGGTVAGRIVPAAWFGQPWWRSPLAASAPEVGNHVVEVTSLRKDHPLGV